jgi:DNA-binding transcriptional MerR regulator
MNEQLSIKDAAQRTGISETTLRWYERIGLLQPVGRAPNGHRRYGEEDLGRIGFLQLLRGTGMSVSRMQRFVELERDGDAGIPGRLVLLEEHETEVLTRLGALRSDLARIQTKIGIYRALSAEPTTATEPDTTPRRPTRTPRDTETAHVLDR